MREARLIGLLLSDINKQRQAAGSASVSLNPQSINSPVTQIRGRVATEAYRPGGQTPTSTVADVRDQRQTQNAAQPITITPGVNAPIDYVPPPATDGSYQQVGDEWRQAGVTNPTQQSGAMGKPGALGYNSAPGGYDPTRKSPEDIAKQAGDDVVNQMKKAGGDPASYEKAYNDAYASALAKEKGVIDLQTSQKAKDKADADLRASQQNLGGPESVTGQTAPPAWNILRSMSPEMAAVADAMDAQSADLSRREAEANTMISDMETSQKTADESIKTQMEDMRNDLKTTAATIQETLQQGLEENSKFLAQQQKSADDQLVWTAQKNERILAKQKVAQHESMIVQYALGGGFGQEANLRAVNESDNEFEGRIMDLQTELGFQRTDLAVKFSGLFVENNNKYRTDLISSYKEMRSGLMSINIKGIDATQARATAEQKILKDGFDIRAAIRKEYVDNNLANVKEMNDIMSSDKEAKQKKEDTLWDRLFKQRAADGNLNPGLTQKILDDMKASGIDTTGIDANALTIEQSNEMYRRAKDAEAASGKLPLSEQIKKLTMADDAFDLLDKSEAAILEYTGVGGTIGGMTGLGDVDPSFPARVGKFVADVATGISGKGSIVSSTFERQREAVATFALVNQVIGKALEGGVLRKEDEIKYSKLLPNLRDTDELRTLKLNQLREMMTDGKKNLLDNMRRSGYNTSGYNVGGAGEPLDPIGSGRSGSLTNEEIDEIMNKIDAGEPLSDATPTGFLNSLAIAHVQHEGYGTKNAVSITGNNNPGALRWSDGQKAFGGVKPGGTKPNGERNDTGFTWFPDVSSGYLALTADLRAKLTGKSAHIDYSKDPTLLDYISVYAPSADRNNPNAYARAVVKKLQNDGYFVDVDTPLAALSVYI